METLKFNVFNFLNKSKKTTVPLVLLCPTFPYFQKRNFNQQISAILTQCHNMDKFIEVYESFIPKHDEIMQTSLCRADFEMLN